MDPSLFGASVEIFEICGVRDREKKKIQSS
jgi:hypothetical protein